ncbi:MAG: glutamine--tRNA ligase/YqeY domain fusion protein [Deltaproteobacteria bacterium]|nr:glutamine--tRNA ligase/YqeY domain fusion protein [Deltaproteobacteria bacterium]
MRELHRLRGGVCQHAASAGPLEGCCAGGCGALIVAPEATVSDTISAATSSNFIRDIITDHLERGRYDKVVTRFPPEPNGYLHIGHAKSICLNFGLAKTFGGVCHLRMDDTNPTKEETEYVESIANDVRWLGFEWKGQDATTPFYASDYFQQLYDWAELLIQKGKAYVDSVSRDELRKNRGTLTEPGRESPFRSRTPDENLDLFRRMKAGEFEEGEHVLRAKIDLASPNMLMRDPPLYRILKAHHHRTGDAWCIYPMYDYAHGLSDALEGITHSICTLEFENNRELYDWCLDAVGFSEPRPHQYEFARLVLDYTVMSKRKLLLLVKDGLVDGWDDPRMPTIAGLRRRGVRPEAIRAFADMIGVAKTNSTVDIGKLEYCIREDLNAISPRAMAVLDPLEVVIDTWPDDLVESGDSIEAPWFPPELADGRTTTRRIPLGKTLYIERDDFMEDPPKDFHRLSPGQEVRLRYGFVIRCDRVVKDEDGKVIRLHVSHDAETRHGTTGSDKKKVKGTIHWVDAQAALDAEVRVYDRLFKVAAPDREDDFLSTLNPESKVVMQAKIEPALSAFGAGQHVQFERQGFFFTDPSDHKDGVRVFNKVVGLRDTWAKVKARTEVPSAVPEPVAKKAAKAPDTRPEKLSRAEIRERRFAADPALAARFEAMKRDLGMSEDEAELCAETHALADFVEAALAVYAKPQAIAKWVVNELLREVKERDLETLPLTAVAFAGLVKLVDEGQLSTTAGKTVFAELVQQGGDPEAIVARLGLAQVDDDGAIEAAADQVIASNADQVAKYRSGKTQLLGFFVGQVMKATGGRARPDKVSDIVKSKLG